MSREIDKTGVPPRHSSAHWYSPSKQLDFDTPQEGVTSLNDQPRVARAVHGQPDLGCDVHLHGNVQEANETGGDHEVEETKSAAALRQISLTRACPASRIPGFALAVPASCYYASIMRLAHLWGSHTERFPGPSSYL